MKKLKDAGPGIDRHFERIDRLGRKLGCVVFQLPPTFEVNLGRLDEFLHALPQGHRYAFELRHPSWHTAEVEALLGRYNAAFCIFEIAGFHSEFPVTADFTYVRLHGPGGAYQGSYSGETLGRWAARIRKWKKDLSAIYVYFDNDQHAYAVANAQTLKQMVSE
jgi:uncharacterized protein YecE (DUF72 family)